MRYCFQQVDVFSRSPCMGNPVAVFVESQGLSSADMQKIARWTNLSETTFVNSSASADYHVRIFTPSCELPFAGHPTLGTAWALTTAGIIKKNNFIQECAFGFINISIEAEKVFFELPTFRSEALGLDGEFSSALGIALVETKLINVGATWVTAELKPGQDIFSVQLDVERLRHLFNNAGTDGITIYCIGDDGVVQVRSFFMCFPQIIEDPVCGSGNAAVAIHIRECGNENRVGSSYEAVQGRALGRDGRISVVLGEKIKVGGTCRSVVQGIADVGCMNLGPALSPLFAQVSREGID